MGASAYISVLLRAAAVLFMISFFNIASSYKMLHNGVFAAVPRAGRVVQSRRMASTNFFECNRDELKSLLKSWDQPAFRADQIRHWVLEKGVRIIVDYSFSFLDDC